MPTYKVTDPNTGKTLKISGDSPPTEQELEQIFSQESQGVRGVPLINEPDPGKFEGMSPEEIKAYTDRVQSSPKASFNRGVLDSAEGIKQLGLEGAEAVGMAPKGSADNYTSEVEQRRREFESQYGNVPSSAANRLMGAMLPYMMAPGPKAGKGVMENIMRMSPYGAAIGGAQFVPEGGSRMDNIKSGAVLGAALPAAARTAEYPLAKISNAFMGRMKPGANELMRASKEFDVPLSFGDIKQGAVAPKIETAMESVPVVGLGKFREIQNQRALRAVDNFMDDLSKGMGGDDWERIAQSSMGNKAKNIKKAAGKLYDRVANLAEDRGTVALPQTNRAAKEGIRAIMQKGEEKLTAKDKKVIAMLQRYSEGSADDFATAREIRSDIGDELSDYYKGSNSEIGKKGADKLQAVKNAIDEDLEGFAKQQGGDLYKAWRQADNFYKKQVIPFKDNAIAKAIKSDEPDTIYRQFIKRGRGDRARKFFNALDQKGKESVMYGMVDDAYQQATKGKDFSPAQFAKKLRDVQEARNVFFQGENRRKIDGLVKLMEHAKRGGQYAENPPTGQRVIPLLLAGGAYVEPAAVAGGMGASLLFKKLYTTEAGKRILLSASRLKPGTPQMQRAMSEIEALALKSGIMSQDPEGSPTPAGQQSQQSPSGQTGQPIERPPLTIPGSATPPR